MSSAGEGARHCWPVSDRTQVSDDGQPFAAADHNGAMELHADFSQHAVLDSNALPWTPSPMAGVQHRLLDRGAGEEARATSIVRYAPGSRFSRLRHGGGEKILVLNGVFQDEHGRYPNGSWLRNPHGSVQRPWSEAGCTIWVKTGHLPSTQGPDGSKA
jgi:anti-sigma factor ChrR (cupin superfamily)